MQNVVKYIDERLAQYYKALGVISMLETVAKSKGDKATVQASKITFESIVDDLVTIKSML